MRDLFVIGLVAVSAIAVGTFLFFFQPTPLADQVSHVATQVNNVIQATGITNKTVPISVLADGSNPASAFERTNYRIQSTANLDALWTLIYGYSGTRAVPSVDFTKYEVLAVFDGSHTTNGYTIKVVSVTDENPNRVVVVDHDVPPATCTLKKVSTSPFEIIEVPKTTFTLVHHDEMASSTCP